jgi:hypothetical protein
MFFSSSSVYSQAARAGSRSFCASAITSAQNTSRCVARGNDRSGNQADFTSARPWGFKTRPDAIVSGVACRIVQGGCPRSRAWVMRSARRVPAGSGGPALPMTTMRCGAPAARGAMDCGLPRSGSGGLSRWQWGDHFRRAPTGRPPRSSPTGLPPSSDAARSRPRSRPRAARGQFATITTTSLLGLAEVLKQFHNRTRLRLANIDL